MNLRWLDRILNPIKRKIFLLVGRAIVTAVDNSGVLQKIQVAGFDGETITDIERLQPYGLETYPVIASDESVILFVNGNRNADKGISIVVANRKYRPTDLAEGDVCIYSKDSNLDNQNRITLKPINNEIEIKTADSRKLILNTSKMEYTDNDGNTITAEAGKLKLNGTLIELGTATESFLKGDTFDTWLTATLLTIFNTHTHSGVQAGGGNTGVSNNPLIGPSGHLSVKIKGE